MNFETELRIAKGVAQQAFEVWGCPELSEKTVFEFNGRFTSRLGDATFRRNGTHRIRLSRPIWPHIDDDERENTIVHEAAHIAAPHLKLEKLKQGKYGVIQTPRIGHGPEWKRLMRQAGFRPERCHTVDTAALGLKRKRYRYTYPCGCSTPCKVGPKHHKAVNEFRRVKCLLCQTYLVRNTFRKVEI